MPGIRDTKKIDLIARAKDGSAILVIVEDGPWEAKEENLRFLVEKLNTYVGYVKDGQFKEMYPHMAEKSVVIQINSFHEFDSVTKQIFEQLVNDMREKFSITLRFELMKK